jgi:hypothetical protein
MKTMIEINGRDYSVYDAIRTSYYEGAVETVSDRVDNLTEWVALCVSKLVAHNLITQKELDTMLPSNMTIKHIEDSDDGD